MKKIGILTSGGDSPGMNAAIRSAVRCGIDKGLEVYGIYRGYEGLLEGDIKKFERKDVADILHRGGTVIKTARSDRFMTEEGRKQAAAILETFEIEGLIIIGGDGSLKGARALEKTSGITVMCIPGTIDNDLGYTDFTIGFDTAVNTVLDAISKMRDTSSSHEKTSVIEVMGRNCGDIALYSGIAGGAEAVLVPEFDYDINAICRKILSGANRGKLHSIVINAEGSGIDSQKLVDEIEKGTGRATRLLVLSYLQRGGVPTLQDRWLATVTAAKAVELLHDDSDSRAIGIVEGHVLALPLEEAINAVRVPDMEAYALVDVLSK